MLLVLVLCKYLLARVDNGILRFWCLVCRGPLRGECKVGFSIVDKHCVLNCLRLRCLALVVDSSSVNRLRLLNMSLQ